MQVEPTVSFERPEPGEFRPGGGATSNQVTLNRNSFSQASGNLDFKREFDFKIGNGLFRKLWVSAPASTEASDGLGPLHNARACQRCHLRDGRGHPPSANWPEDDAISMLMRLSVPPQSAADRALLASRKAGVIAEPTYGGQLQDFAVQGHLAEGRIHIIYEDVPVELADGSPSWCCASQTTASPISAMGRLHEDVMLSPRVANPMIGLGTSGGDCGRRTFWPWPIRKTSMGMAFRAGPTGCGAKSFQKAMLGRFGWKAGMPTVREQSAAAFAGDIGLSTTLLPAGSGDCTAAQALCMNVPNGNTPRLDNVEVSDTMLDLVTFYSSNLAVPERRDADDPQVLTGKALFYGAGCTSCHRPKFVTARDGVQPELAGQLIWPYTDMLLHDMGEGLADDRARR